MVSIGKKVANFSLPATGNKNLSLKHFAGTHLVLYFYPKDNTPGCTLEGQEFSASYPQFRQAGAEILGVSRDSVKTHEGFRARQGFPFDLLSDPEGSLCTRFGVIGEKSLYGRKFTGIIRSTFLIDSSGVLRQEWRQVRARGHAGEVLQAVIALAR